MGIEVLVKEGNGGPRFPTPLRSTADIFFAYLLQALNFRIWYAAWPFPWLLLDAGTGPQTLPARYRLRYGLWFLLTSQLSVILYGHVRVHHNIRRFEIQ